jgi:hypothetical protein
MHTRPQLRVALAVSSASVFAPVWHWLFHQPVSSSSSSPPPTTKTQAIPPPPTPYQAPPERGGEGKLLTKLGNPDPARNSRELLNLSPRLELRHISQLTRGACYAIKSEHNLGKTVAGTGRAVRPWLEGLHGHTLRTVPRLPSADFAIRSGARAPRVRFSGVCDRDERQKWGREQRGHYPCPRAHHPLFGNRCIQTVP